MDILFARHGNTFDPGDKVVWVGRETDLPLVDKGLAQASLAALALRRAGLIPDAVYTASLKRTRTFASIVCETLGLPPPVVDDRLDEVDYGDWAGRTNDEIAATGAGAVAMMEAWGARDEWPAAAGWSSGYDEVMASVRGFARDILRDGRHERPLVVSSNGILRFLPRVLLEGEKTADGGLPASFKMRTGHLGRIARTAGQTRLLCWDRSAAEFA
ncbi:MAG: histidine phosphatase family protein [Telmatospirillum sp.]|nr:histidine phosphatase family protein [Telmatospirillum sp.]